MGKRVWRALASDTPLMARWGRLGYFLAFLGAIYGALWLHEATPREDRLLVLGIGLIYALAVLVMLIGTTTWTVRGLGLLGTLSADAVLYTTAAGASYGWTDAATEWRLTLIRALFYAGGSLMVVGLATWLVGTRFGTRDESGAI